MAPDSHELDAVDMRAMVGGEETALNRIMDRHGEKLFHFLVRLLNNEAEAEDVAQETFVRVFQHRSKYDPGRKLATWLYTIAANLARNRLRTMSRHPAVSLDATTDDGSQNLSEVIPAGDATPAESLASEENAAAVREAIAALPENLRTPLLLAEYEDMAVGEIARVIGTSLKAAESRLYRARQLLREYFAQAGVG